MNMFKVICYVLFMRLCGVYGMEEQTIFFQLKHPDKSSTGEYWQKEDFEKITLFNTARKDMGEKSINFKFIVEQDKPYLTHEYFKNLITGNFINQGLTQYINNYNYFIGNDIQLPFNNEYQPFPSSLKWKVFKDNEDFFRIHLTFRIFSSSK